MWSATNKTVSYPDMSGSCFSSFWVPFDAANLGISGLNTKCELQPVGFEFLVCAHEVSD